METKLYLFRVSTLGRKNGPLKVPASLSQGNNPLNSLEERYGRLQSRCEGNGEEINALLAGTQTPVVQSFF
jgi:hypothetical protein